jgi:sugar O-acyltransferase (sialic acid O-acetyltransferase NeuD family)
MRALIVGAGAQGRVILDILRDAGNFSDIAFVDENPSLRGTEINGAPVIGALRDTLGDAGSGTALIVAVGNPIRRLQIGREIRAASIPLLNAVHPSAAIARSARLGSGIMVGATAVINSNAQLGDDTIINTAAVVEHDCIVSDGAVIGPGAHLGARVSVGRAAFIATGAILLSRISVGPEAVIGAGAVVTKDLSGNTMSFGVPARIVETIGADFNWNRVL